MAKFKHQKGIANFFLKKNRKAKTSVIYKKK